MSGLSAGMRTSGSGHGWPMGRVAIKYQGFKGNGPESAKLGSARRQGDKFPWEATGLDVKKCCFLSALVLIKNYGQKGLN
ncbi:MULTISPECIES: hypothetical protein [Oceanospirillaceae]|uniref:hypothetical protein n=1 Tax=Oceanospirillaceae TaxID=135620 RepID=UPI00118FD84A|nr:MULTISPECIES: hypothetical protein [Thalassolituus]MCB2387287.1 hypothetical protein [Thalassolituus alkanivorans]MCB2424410.1 hypothetical protein [Thalassolituus alkanivorans]TVV39433.1 hypothetical protein FOT50_19575 [Thalassolituus sp. C2-1]